jgi:amino acid adenylation domain-containing protein
MPKSIETQPGATGNRPESLERVAPASFAQERLWVLEQLERDRARYNLQLLLWIEGELDVEALALALSTVVRRHEALRTTFSFGEDGLVQHVWLPVAIELAETDLRGVESVIDAVDELASAEADRPFDLTRELPIRATLARTADAQHVLVLGLHHIVADAWSTRLLYDELAELYAAYSSGAEPSLPDPPVQYADYALWEQATLPGERLKGQLQYWRDRLAGAPLELGLPTDRRRAQREHHRGASASMPLDEELIQDLAAIGQREGASLFMVLLAVFQVLLARYSGETDLVVGTHIASRLQPGLESLIGFFVNVLALRVDVSDDPPFLELLARVRTTTLEAFDHQDAPFHHVVDQVQQARSAPARGLADVLFQVSDLVMLPRDAGGVRFAPWPVRSQPAAADLAVSVRREQNGFVAIWDYDADLFTPATIERMQAHFGRLLASVRASPAAPLSQLVLLGDDERVELLAGSGSPEVSRSREPFAIRLFERRAGERPDAIAVRAAGRALTYRELNRRANRLARWLMALGVGPEDLVALHIARSSELCVGLLGIMKAGAAFVALDPQVPSERLQHMLDDSGAVALLHLAGAPCGLRCNRTLTLSGDADLTKDDDADPHVEIHEQSLAYAIYTSGSTGKPKGVMIEQAGLRNLVAAQRELLALEPGDAVLQFAPISFDASIFEMFLAWGAGAALQLVDPRAPVLGTELEQLIVDGGVTAVTMSPGALGTVRPDRCRRLRTVTSAGDVCPPDLASRWLGAGRRFLNLYGPTETTIWATAHEVSDRATEYDARVPIGRTITNLRAYVLDGHLQPVPIGVPGELVLGGAGVARGYQGSPGMTALRFIPDPLSSVPGARAYRTGDIVRWTAGGCLDFMGRADHQIKIRGYRIEPAEIEAALLGTGQISECVVVEASDTAGEGKLVAYLTPRADVHLEEAELRRRIGAVLPDFMIPSGFVTVSELPRTDAGKVDRTALQTPAEEPSGGSEDASPLELRLGALWSELLGLDAISPDDDFFALGGHSLLAARVVSHVERDLGLRVPVRMVFERPRLREFAEGVLELELERLSQPAAPSKEDMSA